MLSTPPRKFHATVVNLLSLCLTLTPLWALPAERRASRTPKLLLTTLAVPQITHAHKGGELLVKFRYGAPEWAKQQVKDAWSKESKELKGKKGVEKLKIKDGAVLNQTIADLQQVNNIVEWVEPNYLVTKADAETGRRGDRVSRRRADAAKKPLRLLQAAAPTPNDPNFPTQ